MFPKKNILIWIKQNSYKLKIIKIVLITNHKVQFYYFNNIKKKEVLYFKIRVPTKELRILIKVVHYLITNMIRFCYKILIIKMINLIWPSLILILSIQNKILNFKKSKKNNSLIIKVTCSIIWMQYITQNYKIIFLMKQNKVKI